MKTIDLKYDNFFGFHLLDKPLYLINDLKFDSFDSEGKYVINEKCIYITDEKVIVKNIFDEKPIDNIIKDDICFYKLCDRNIYISLELFLKEDDDSPDIDYEGDCGYQMVLIDKGDKYLLDYQDGFIIGSSSKKFDDFQILTCDWQW